MFDVRLGSARPGTEPVEEDGTAAQLRVRAAVLARGLPAGRTDLARPALAGDRLAAFVEGLLLGGYRYSLASTRPARREVILSGTEDVAAFERGRDAGRATLWARDLANTPADVKTPDWLARTAAKELAAAGAAVDVRDEHWLAERGFGGVLAVGGGSASPPRLIEASWRPRRASGGSGAGARRLPHVVLVGKGITFDTGGLNIKHGEAMRPMRTDMAGGAAVLAALALLARTRVPVRVSALVPCAENAVGAGSFRPGDVITHYGGRTSEVSNTDAEGRLVLADAMAYAAARLRPDVLIDIATLTGAMKVALGVQTAGYFATDDTLAAALEAAGRATGEPLWRMPLSAEYEAQLASSVADADQAPGSPGAITAALFLQHFTAGLPWAHLDIAGPARAAKDAGLSSQGATGFGARLLAAYVAGLA